MYQPPVVFQPQIGLTLLAPGNRPRSSLPSVAPRRKLAKKPSSVRPAISRTSADFSRLREIQAKIAPFSGFLTTSVFHSA
jgi:hypothetical protein